MTPLEYEIRVAGAVPDEIVGELGDVRVQIQPVGTVLTGAVVDQAALHGLLNRLRQAGVELIEMRRPAGPGSNDVKGRP